MCPMPFSMHGTLDETVYMRQPPGYVHSLYPGYVCQLKKSLYGLRQAPGAWYSMLFSFLVQHGFTQSKADTSLFFNHLGSHIVLVLVYVDDIIITGSDSIAITSVISQLSFAFAIKDLGNLHYFLGIEVTKSAGGLLMSQHKCAHDLSAKAGMLDCKLSDAPAAVKPPLDANSAVPFSDLPLFRSLVGSLQYLTLTIPEISHAVNSVCQHMHSPTVANFTAVKRLLRYIKGTLIHGLWFQPGPFLLSAFSDSNWAGDHT